MKKIISLLLAFVLALSLAACAATQTKPYESVNIRLGGLKGPTSMGMAKLLDDAENGRTANTYTFTMTLLFRKYVEMEGRSFKPTDVGRAVSHFLSSHFTQYVDYIVKGDKEGKKITVNDLELRNGNISEKSKTETVGAERGRLLPQEIGMIVTDIC